jgi:peptidoglycan/xylan/chitin deacetylase (PgdA/CDA1 family)
MAVRKSAYLKIGGFSTDVNQGADVDLDRRLRKTGTVIIDRKIITATSSRRFQAAFFETIFRYYVNDLCLLTIGKPLFHNFKDYRLDSLVSVKSAFARPAISALLILFFFGWIIQNPTSHLLENSIFNDNAIKSVALTFEDGPGEQTDTILKILQSRNVHATFFLTGKNAGVYPEIVRKIDQSGHEIGNHTYSHSFEPAIDNLSRQIYEIRETDRIIEKITGKRTFLFRPPQGWKNPWSLQACDETGLSVVLWSIDSKDWQNTSPQSMLREILEDLKPGSIILFHDHLENQKSRRVDNTIAVLPALLDSLQNRGYHLVTISELKSENDQFSFSEPIQKTER